jgi:hypothetical protein
MVSLAALPGLFHVESVVPTAGVALAAGKRTLEPLGLVGDATA